MGRGRKWFSGERQKLALAWRHSSMDPLSANNERSEAFQTRAFEQFRAIAPLHPEKGTYCDRGQRTVFNFWRNVISPDLRKFNTSLRKVYAAKPTGVDDQQKINMAVAIHIGKTDQVMDVMKASDPREWTNYLAWLVVRDLPKYKYNECHNDDKQGEDSMLSFPPPGENRGAVGLPAAVAVPNSGNAEASEAESMESISVEAIIPQGRKRAKLVCLSEKRHEEQVQLLKSLNHGFTEIREEQTKLRKTMQWGLYYNICKDDGDQAGRGKAKRALESLLGITTDAGAGDAVVETTTAVTK